MEIEHTLMKQTKNKFKCSFLKQTSNWFRCKLINLLFMFSMNLWINNTNFYVKLQVRSRNIKAPKLN